MKGKRVIQALSPLWSCLPIRRSSKEPNNTTTSANSSAAQPEVPSVLVHGELNEEQQQNLRECAEYFQRRTAELDIVKTTTHPNGRVIDWIPIESQGTIATPPPAPSQTPEDPNRPTQRPKAELEIEGAEKGPAGTVPIPRQNLDHLSPNQSLKQRLSKAPPPEVKAQSTFAGDHWYASTAQAVSNLGGSANFSLFKPYVQSSSDFSLLQTAVIRYNVPYPGNPSTTTSQTVEAGWINYPAQTSSPHLFTYFTTNGYTESGNNLSGWNRDVSGWVQYDSTIFPGTAFTPLSTDGGTQYEMNIRYYLSGGNWWLWVLDRWVGYYPASLFSANESDASKTLATGSSQIDFYGEIYNSESTETTTDMGSGEFPETGWAHSAYIRNILYTNTGASNVNYDGSGQLITSDSSRYRMTTHFNSGSDWGSYIFLGGPGAGGVRNG